MLVVCSLLLLVVVYCSLLLVHVCLARQLSPRKLKKYEKDFAAKLEAELLNSDPVERLKVRQVL